MLVLSFGANTGLIFHHDPQVTESATLKRLDLHLWKCFSETLIFDPALLPLEANGSFPFYLNRNRIRLKGSEF